MTRRHDLADVGPIWMIGCGNMGSAMLRGWLDAGLDPAQVTVIKPIPERVPEGVRHLVAPPPDGAAPAIVVLAVKPKMLDAVAPAIAPALASEALLLSVLAGVELASLRARFPQGEIVRMMPNTPVAIRQGVSALHGAGLGEAARAQAERLAAALGHAEWIEDEARFDAVSVVMGCGPAFLFRFIEALADGGTAVGLPADQAARLALATVAGAGALAARSGESPAILADRVASPGGSTRAGLNVLDDEGGITPLMRRTVEASTRRTAEMAAEARG